MKVLVIDIGGTSIKVLATGKRISRKLASGAATTPAQMVAGVQNITRGC